MTRWPAVMLGEVLTQDARTERITDTANEAFLTIKLYGNGLTKRNIGAGKTPKPFVGYRVAAGQFVYSRIDARNGAYGMVPPELDGAVCSKDFPKFDVDPRRADTSYLIRMVQAPAFYRKVQDLSFGATNRQRVQEAEFLRLTVPLPALSEQRRIAAVLDHADELRAKRREALARLDELTQSIFIDLFGDSRTIHTRWPRAALKDVLTEIESGRSPTCHARPASNEEYGVLKLGAVTYGVFDPSQNKALPEGVEPHTRYEVKAGDLLFTRKNTADLVGAAALVRETRGKLLLPDLIFRLRIDPDSRMEPAYLQAVLMYPPIRRGIQGLAGGSAGSMPNISKAKLLTVDLPHPPAELQAEFARRVQSVERLKEDHRGALTKLDALFASLQSRAFRGEL